MNVKGIGSAAAAPGVSSGLVGAAFIEPDGRPLRLPPLPAFIQAGGLPLRLPCRGPAAPMPGFRFDLAVLVIHGFCLFVKYIRKK